MSDTNGNNGSGYTLAIRGMASGGSSAANLAAFVVYSNAVNIGGIYGTTASGGAAVYVNSSGTLGTSTSLRAAKTNITPIADASWINGLQPVTFNYRLQNEDKSYSDEFDPAVEFGLIAEEVEAIDKRFCFYSDDGSLLGVRYEKLIVPAIRLIQELSAKVAALEGVR